MRPENRPFQNVPGRDAARDRAPEFDIARYYYDERVRIAEDADRLNALIVATKAEYDLAPPQWAQWLSVALGFDPDLILELGRSKGNSTALFCQAASRLKHTRVVSLCGSNDWVEETLPRLTRVVPAGWLDALDARVTDIRDVDFAQLLDGSRRVLVLWDAHGFDIAEIVLGRILPLLCDRPHLVLVHDITDNRYAYVPRSYEGQGIWQGTRWQQASGYEAARVNIGWMNSAQDQVIAIADFAVRNDLTVGSADHEYAQFFRANPQCADEMRGLLGDRFFSLSAHWAFLSLAGKAPPFHFPPLRFRHRSDVVIHDVHPKPWFDRPRRLPRAVRTSAVPWRYAAVMVCRPTADVPADAPRSYCVRVQVDGGPIGIGLLSADRSVFLQERRVNPSLERNTVLLPIPPGQAVGGLVVHTWDVPQAAVARIEDISVVW